MEKDGKGRGVGGSFLKVYSSEKRSEDHEFGHEGGIRLFWGERSALSGEGAEGKESGMVSRGWTVGE